MGIDGTVAVNGDYRVVTAELAPKRQLAGIAGQNLEVHMLR